MHRPEQSYVSFAATAIGVASAVDVDAAYDFVRADVFKQLLAQAWVLEWTGTRWAVMTETTPGSPIAQLVDWGNSIGDPLPDFAVHHVGPADVTIVAIGGADDPRVALAIEGDWSYLRDALIAGVPLLALALHVVRERATKDESARLLVDGYARIRRLSRLRTQDDVARRVVRDVSELLGAERISLALFRDDEQCLSIVAAEGVSLSSVKGVRIAPGEWVIGHVYASRRPVFVRDVGRLPAFSANSTRYRTKSFAAVPMLAGSEAVGVITVTDKRGSEAFTRRDELVLRTLGAAAAVAIVAARSVDAVTRLEYAATIDSLTGLLNRPGFDHRLHQELERTRRESGHLAMLMGDVDDFKTINDTRGHQVGDAVLKHVGSVIRSSVRVFDVCARFGGDEFAVVMPNSDRDSAILCAERIRRRLAERTDDHELPALSISIGVAVVAAGDAAADLISRADECLYRAKADGKNLVRSHPPQTVELPGPLQAVVDSDEPKPIEIRQTAPSGVADDSGAASAELRYVLVVDAEPERAAFCLQCVAPFRVGFLLARDGAQAAGIIDRFGAPLLLVVDIAQPNTNGFELVDHLRDRHGDRSEVIAWSASREMREYAAARLGGHGVHVMANSAARPIIKSAIEHCLDRRVEAEPENEAAASPAWSPQQLQRVMAELTYRVQHLVTTPGVAVYLRSPGERTYRAAFCWNSDGLMPHSSSQIPSAFQEVSTTGRTLVARDLKLHVDEGAQDDAVRGLAAVPVRAGAEVLGALCVFDVRPLQVTDAQIAALESLGRTVVEEVEFEVRGDRLRPIVGELEIIEERPVTTIATKTIDWPPALLERVGGEFAVAREVARARREGKEMSVILFEIAPLTTDADLEESVQQASETLLRTIRQSDLPIRWSGREFLVVLPGLAGNGARMVAERVRAALQAGARHRVAVAGGVAELDDEEGFGDVVNKARERVGLARGRGHNRIL
jgi:diguanylate cyclase (GGDEF)-like protein